MLFSLQHYLPPFHPLTTDTLGGGGGEGNYYTLIIKMACVCSIFTCSYTLTHPFFLYIYTIITHVGGSNGVITETMKHYIYPSLTTPTPFKSQKILSKTEHWAQIYFNQKETKYISHSNIRASVETRPPKLHNLLQFSPASIPDILWTSPRASRVSAIHVFLVFV